MTSSGRPPRVLSLVELAAAPLARLRQAARVEVRAWTDTQELMDPRSLAAELNAKEMSAVFVEADFVLTETFEAAPGLRFVGVCRGDAGHVDVEAATRAGAVVTHAPGRNAAAVAELTIGLALAMLRGIPAAAAYVAGRRWEDPVTPYLHMRGAELGRQVVGVIGLGRIGRRTARLAQAFGARVLAADPALTAAQIQAAGCEPAALNALLETATLLTVHCPAMEATRGMIDAPALARLPHGARLVVTTGEGVVDERAAAAALRSGRLAGAAFDVFETHPIRPDHPLLDAPNALLLPHLGGATDATVARYSRMVVEDYLAFLAGARPRRLVNPQVFPAHD